MNIPLTYDAWIRLLVIHPIPITMSLWASLPGFSALYNSYNRSMAVRLACWKPAQIAASATLPDTLSTYRKTICHYECETTIILILYRESRVHCKSNVFFSLRAYELSTLEYIYHEIYQLLFDQKSLSLDVFKALTYEASYSLTYSHSLSWLTGF